MCPWQTSLLTPPEWLAGTLRWWFNIISEHDGLWALGTQHYTTPCRVLMFWKTRYHLFTCHPSLTESGGGDLAGKDKTEERGERRVFSKCSGVCAFMFASTRSWKSIEEEKEILKSRNPTGAVFSSLCVCSRPIFFSLIRAPVASSRGFVSSTEIGRVGLLLAGSVFNVAPRCHWMKHLWNGGNDIPARAHLLVRTDTATVFLCARIHVLVCMHLGEFVSTLSY